MPGRFLFAFSILLTFLAASPVFSEQATHTSLVKLAPRLSLTVAKMAANASRCAAQRMTNGEIDKLAVIDYSLPSTKKRFWLFDLSKKRLLLEDLVAHGKNTGENLAQSFSNDSGSFQSSLGLFQIGQRYIGKHGTSLRLIGLEAGINDAALDRAIVIHGADYVSPQFIQKHQRLGRSYGCPALPLESARKVIETLSDGSSSFLFSYYPDQNWIRNSEYLNSCEGI